MHQWQQDFGTIVGTKYGVRADIGEVRQYRGVPDPLPAWPRAALGVDGVVGAIVLRGQFEEQAWGGYPVHEASVAKCQGREADTVGVRLETQQGRQNCQHR
ncbi:hypothetical protein D9M68_697050 [compost metagenome]